jgi:hypothetical protein
VRASGYQFLVFVLLSATGILPALANNTTEDRVTQAAANFEPVHWAFSSFFGTGWYQKKDARSVYVLRIPPRQVLRQSSITDTGERRVGVEISYPLTIGLHNIEDLGGVLNNDNFGTVALAPGIAIEFPVSKDWYLRMSAHAGWGTELEQGDSAWIYSAGVKSRYRFSSSDRYRWYLLNGVYYAGFSPDRGRSDQLLVGEAGLEFEQLLANARLLDRPVNLHWNLMYAFYGRDLHFNLPDGSFEPIEDQFEIGLQASFRDGPFKLFGLNIHRVGIGYRFSPNGEFSALTFSLRSWFTK